MRLFVALHPPTDVLGHVDAALAEPRRLHSDLRWIPPVRWHLTLAFYGEVPDDSVAGVTAMVERRLRRRKDAGPLDLAFSGAGAFARRALWVGVIGDVDRLGALSRAVSTDRRPYRPHLTVARIRGATDARPAADLLAEYAGPPWRAESVHLVRSVLGATPAYDDIAAWPLQDSAGD